MFLRWILSHLLFMGIFSHLCTHKIRWVNAMINLIRMIMVSESSTVALRFSYYFVIVALFCFNIWNLTFPNGFQMNFFHRQHQITNAKWNTSDSLARQIIIYLLSWCWFLRWKWHRFHESRWIFQVDSYSEIQMISCSWGIRHTYQKHSVLKSSAKVSLNEII